MPFANILIRPSVRAATRNGGATSQHLRRTYATQRPVLPEGGNKPLMIAAIVGIPALAYFMIPSRPAASGQPAAHASKAPNLDPAARKRERDANEPHERKYMHPEHKDPETFKPAFGQLHQPKRVDSAPDGRNHQAMSDRARQYD
ncbi:hypothetical protein F5Y08DRAFT_171149 [Xylaria arbuscula]|nr:hypothetical protein F5Y08DRAFT_171149 [Xylaria arbuscula]